MSSVFEQSAARAAAGAGARRVTGLGTVEPASEPLPLREAAPVREEDNVSLPRFAVQEGDKLFIDVSRIESPDHFRNFIARVFDNGLLFNGLDYDTFQRALHLGGTADGGAVGKLRLAAGIAPFPAARRALYKMVKFQGQGEGEEVEYVFEPGEIERIVEVTVQVPPDEKGGTPTTRVEKQKISEPAEPDFDEFIADMWGKGVRFGIDAAAVKKALGKREVERMVIARAKAPSGGNDASVQEQSDALHRNNTPRLLPDGRVDLATFQNRFPMVQQGTVLLKKIPRKLGEQGRKVGGEAIEPEIPADVDLNKLAGLGTQVESRRDGDYLVAIVPGFLIIDTRSQQMSVTEKIVSHEGVNLRTTGNLSLDSSDFEEHGEVQEWRSVEGKNMTFHGLVCGIIASKGGKVRISDISGGQARSPGGSITATGRASRAIFEAPGGEITLAYAESCTILGGTVKIEHAVGCQIVADVVEIGNAEGCTVAAKSVTLGQVRPTRSAEALVTVLTPDSAEMDKRLAAMRADLGKIEAALREKSRLVAEAREQPELKNYLVLDARIRSGELKLTTTQEMNWPKLVAKVTPLLTPLRRLIEENKALKSKYDELAGQVQGLASEGAEAAQNRQCAIRKVEGETYVRSMAFASGAQPLTVPQAKEALAKLREAPSGWLFSDASGEFRWKYEKRPGGVN